jgi:hypothetical protein
LGLLVIAAVFLLKNKNKNKNKLDLQPINFLTSNVYRVAQGCHLGWIFSQFGATSNKTALTFV